MTPAILFSMKTMELLENGLQPQSGVASWFSTISLVPLQICHSWRLLWRDLQGERSCPWPQIAVSWYRSQNGLISMMSGFTELSTLMVYSHCTVIGSGPGIRLMGSNILYYAEMFRPVGDSDQDPLFPILPVPFPVQCELAIISLRLIWWSSSVVQEWVTNLFTGEM